MSKMGVLTKIQAFLLVASFICKILAQDGGDFMEKKQECAKEFPFDESALKELHKGELTEVDENTKCFLKCLLEKSGHIDEDGNVQTTKEEESLPHFAKMKEVLEKCKDITVKSCDDAFQFKKCLIKEMKESMKNN